MTGKDKKGKYPIHRDGIKYENPEKFFDFGDEIGKGKFSVVRKATCKLSGDVWAAKMIYFDDADTLKFAIREYDLMVSGKFDHAAVVKLHAAYMVRKYLIIIMDLVDGKTLLDQFCHKASATEDDVAVIIRQLCEVLHDLHQKNIVHLDIRPTNIRYSGREIKLLDYNSARQLANKNAGGVVDVIGDTEFCGPELLNFENVLAGSDMWSVAVIMYILLSGISPFFYEDEDKVLACVGAVKWCFDPCAFENISEQAKDFISKCLIRCPENRMTAMDALKHQWLSDDYSNKRKAVTITDDVREEIKSTDERLYREEEEEYVEASFVFRTFEEEEFESPDESDEE